MLRYINMWHLTPEIQYKMCKINFGKITNFVKKILKNISFPLANKITAKIIVNYYFFNFENNFWPNNVSKYISDMIANEFWAIFFLRLSRKLIWIWSSKCSIIWSQNVAKL